MRQRGVFEKVPGSGIFWARYADGSGRIRREKVGNKGAAIKLYAKRKTEVLQGKKLPEQLRAKRITFDELATDCLAYSKTHKGSHRHDRYRLEVLKAEFGARDAASITHQDLNGWLERHGERQEWLPATYNRHRALLSLLFRLAVENGKLQSNPARLVRHRKEVNQRLRWLTAEEEAALQAEINDNPEWAPHLLEFVIAVNTGMRLSEQYGLDWAQVDLQQRVLRIPRSKHGEPRHVRINPLALAAFQEALARNGGIKRGLVFSWVNATEAARHEWFNTAVLKANIENFRWHDLRHTFASRLVMNGTPLRVVQELMGHKTIQMTCRYAHLAPSVELEAVDNLALAWGKKVKDAAQEARALQNRPTGTRTDTALTGLNA